ncbi:hypothetical protein CDL15_Pgr021348 [Punica granatum]|uniref:Uncharacterized protein n=1 Tax=Punica granatum TaxID=22663 RepID=A0A218WQ59_PUNGR|nr:hypothetical protein CDL15_Pgr021348 [Punica granatum]
MNIRTMFLFSLLKPLEPCWKARSSGTCFREPENSPIGMSQFQEICYSGARRRVQSARNHILVVSYHVGPTLHLRADVRDSKTASSQGMVRPMSWSKPNSSSAAWRRVWNSGRARNEIGTMYRVLLGPT